MMPINFTGETIPIHRVMTGFWSLDRAFINEKGDLGFPVRMIAEIYGPTHTGKSTFCYTLAAIIAEEQKKDVSLVDLEGFDPEFVATVMDYATQGDINVHNIAMDHDEEDLEALADLFIHKETPCAVGILDSVSAIAPQGEVDGKFYDANMGRRGILMAKFTRRIAHIQRTVGAPMMVLSTNHALPRLGKFPGSYTPGGVVKNYMGSVHIKLEPNKRSNKVENYPDGSYVIKGWVAKNKWGKRHLDFKMFCVSGHGFHRGLTALVDCETLGLVKRKKGGIIVLNGEDMGRLSTFVKNHDDPERFIPFQEALMETEGGEKAPVSEEGMGSSNDNDEETNSKRDRAIRD